MVRRWALLTVVAALSALAGTPLISEERTADLLVADSFENGEDAPDEWTQEGAVPGVKYVYDRNIGSEGNRSLSLQKSAMNYFPIAGWSRLVPHRSQKPVLKVGAKVKASNVTKAVLDVQFFDTNGQLFSHEWAAYIGRKNPKAGVVTHDWKEYSGSVKIPPGTKQIAIALQIYGPGKVWFDELEARYFDTQEAAKVENWRAGFDEAALSKEVVGIPTPIEIQVSSGASTRYLLIPPDAGATKPKGGYPLLVVLPGGNGSAEFHPFVRNLHKYALQGRFVVAQPLAPPQIVWPTRSSVARSATTEGSIGAIIDDVAKNQPIDRSRVYALAWSSSGPAIYATMLEEKSPLAGAFIAMSVFKPDQLPPLAQAAGRRIYLLHSPEDTVCPYVMAKEAASQLAKAGARVTLVDYAGGHGWHGPVHENVRAGMEWLEQQTSR